MCLPICLVVVVVSVAVVEMMAIFDLEHRL